jgi:xylulokinase
MTRSEGYLVGIDIGTGGCKTTVSDTNGEIIGSASQEYITYYPKPGWAEQDVKSWYEAVKTTVRRVLLEGNVREGRIECVCVDGQVHTPVFLDENWKILRLSIPWTDQRSTEQVEKLKKTIGQDRIIRITFNPAATSFTLPQILWVRDNQPDVWKRVYKLLNAKDYIRGRLTEPMWCTDHSDATSTLMFDGNKSIWSNEICESAGIPKEKLPDIMPSARIAARISKTASSDTGIPEGVPVSYGANDVSVETLSAATILAGTCFVKLATSGVISLTTKEPVPDLRGRTVTYCLPSVKQSPDGWFTKSGTASCASSHKWFRDTFGTEESSVAERIGTTAYELFNRMAERVSIGSEGLFFHPYLIGELSPYFDSHLKGSFFGITMRHRKEHFCRAVLEGIAFSIRDSLSIFDELHLPINDVQLIGGGVSSRLWREILCNILGKDGRKPATGDASYGSAMLAGVSIGIFKDLNDAVQKCVRIENITKHDAREHEKYEKLFVIYKKIHDDLAETSRILDETLQGFEGS